MNPNASKTSSMTNFDFQSAVLDTHCSFCGKELDNSANLIRYMNGSGFCNSFCEQSYLEWGTEKNLKLQIEEVIEKLISPYHRDVDLRRLCCEDSTIQRVTRWQPSMRSLLLFGDSGAGKTMLASYIIKKCIEHHKYGLEGKPIIRTYYSGELECAILDSFSKSASNFAKLVNEISTAKLVLIDDLGKEKNTERFENALFNIIDARTRNLLPTIITTNDVGKTFEEKFIDKLNFQAFYRRLNDFFDKVPVRVDLNKKKNSNQTTFL